MKSLLRVLFTAVIVIIILAQAARIERSGKPLNPAISAIDAGARLGLTPANSATDFPLAFNSRACADEVRIEALDLDGRSGEAASDTAPPPGIVRYVFLGSVQDQRDLAAMRARWMIANVLYVAGLRSTKAGTRILSVMIPEACSGLLDLDWAQLSPW